MKFCEHCGHTLSDDAVFCPGCGKPSPQQEAAPAPVCCAKCGTQLAPGQAFCEVCGCPVTPAQPIPNPVPFPQSQIPTASGAPKKKLPKWLLITLISVAGVALAVGIFALCGGFIHRAEMPAVINENTVSFFINEVYENSGETFIIDDIYDYYSYDDIYADIVNAKSGSNFEVNFEQDDGYTTVSLTLRGAMPGNDDYSQYELYQMPDNYDFARDFIIALEETLSGSSKADDYLVGYEKMHTKAQQARITSGDNSNVPLAQYTLSSGILVEITYRRLYNDEWIITYRLYAY